MQAMVILCHITRRVSEERILATAADSGLDAVSAENAASADGPVRILCFKWRQLEAAQTNG